MKSMLAILLSISALLGAGSVGAAAPPPASVAATTAPFSEWQKIEILLSELGRLQGAVFIRNGSEYTAAQAVEHMRYKWNHSGGRVKTAGDFILLCGTKSSVSGLPYRIRLADGTTEDSAVFFRVELAKLEKSATQ